jgi:hypothetical protein
VAWRQVKNDYYYKTVTARTFSSQASACQDIGGQLAMIYNQDSHDAILSIAGNFVSQLGVDGVVQVRFHPKLHIPIFLCLIERTLECCTFHFNTPKFLYHILRKCDKINFMRVKTLMSFSDQTKKIGIYNLGGNVAG